MVQYRPIDIHPRFPRTRIVGKRAAAQFVPRSGNLFLPGALLVLRGRKWGGIHVDISND
jgi:hypothetical protein